MQRLSPRDDRPAERLMRRLDRAAGEINPILIILMVGLLILNAIRIVSLGLSGIPITRVDPNCLMSSTPTVSGADTVNRPI
jgi:hypothetical protein